MTRINLAKAQRDVDAVADVVWAVVLVVAVPVLMVAGMVVR